MSGTATIAAAASRRRKGLGTLPPSPGRGQEQREGGRREEDDRPRVADDRVPGLQSAVSVSSSNPTVTHAAGEEQEDEKPDVRGEAPIAPDGGGGERDRGDEWHDRPERGRVEDVERELDSVDQPIDVDDDGVPEGMSCRAAQRRHGRMADATARAATASRGQHRGWEDGERDDQHGTREQDALALRVHRTGQQHRGRDEPQPASSSEPQREKQGRDDHEDVHENVGLRHEQPLLEARHDEDEHEGRPDDPRRRQQHAWLVRRIA